MPSFCAYSDYVCYYWWSHVNALILCIFRLCVLKMMVTCKCPHFVHILIVCVITDGHMYMPSCCAYSDCVCYYWWSHVNARILCIFRLCVLILTVTCKWPHFVHIHIVCIITDGHMQMPSLCAYSDCVCYYWWSHVNALILCIFRLCMLSLMVTCKCPHVVHIQIVCVITDGHM